MGGKILQFPEKRVDCEWAGIRRIAKAELEKADLRQDLQERILSEFRELYEKYNFVFDADIWLDMEGLTLEQERKFLEALDHLKETFTAQARQAFGELMFACFQLLVRAVLAETRSREV